MTKSLFEKNYKLSIVDLSNNNLSGICKGLFAYQVCTDLTFTTLIKPFSKSCSLSLSIKTMSFRCHWTSGSANAPTHEKSAILTSPASSSAAHLWTSVEESVLLARTAIRLLASFLYFTFWCRERCKSALLHLVCTYCFGEKLKV